MAGSEPRVDSRHSLILPLTVVLTVLCATGATYVGTDCWAGVRLQGRTTTLAGQTIHITERIYRYQWQVALYGPAARMESSLTGRETRMHQWREYVSP